MRIHLIHGSRRAFFAAAAGLATLSILPATAAAETYRVGPGRPLRTLQDVAPKLAPGDVVELDGGATYPGDVTFTKSGSAAAKITIRGVRSGGKRPVIAGGTNTVHVHADHYTLEGLEITGGAARCVFQHGDDTLIRDTAVHGCPNHGILGADEETGSLTLQYVEVYDAGSGDSKHPVYVATDEAMHPGSVFRMEHCFIHDGNGGNNVKSRAERNEIYSNWIEGARYHEIELIGSEEAEENVAREDSDVVGNVFRKTGTHYLARIGGDGTAQSWGRFRFAFNTVLLAPGSNAAFRLYDGIESFVASDNVFYRQGGGAIQMVRQDDAKWKTGSPLIAGTHNWVPAGSTDVPGTWTGTITGADPRFAGAMDFHPTSGSALVDAAVMDPPGAPGSPFIHPLRAPLSEPPPHRIQAVGTARPRSPAGASLDVGAFELPMPGSAAAIGDAPGAEAADPSAAEAGEDASAAEGQGCSAGGRSSGAFGAALIGLALAAAVRRRRSSV